MNKEDFLKMFESMDIEEIVEDKSVEVDKIRVVEYSAKSIAVCGKTMEIKEGLKEIGGKYNANLMIEGEKRSGWIFPNAKKENVNKYLEELSKKVCYRIVMRKREMQE